MPAITPLTAFVRSASGKTMFGDLPPSSSETRAIRVAAVAAICLPTAVEPVKEIFVNARVLDERRARRPRLR